MRTLKLAPAALLLLLGGCDAGVRIHGQPDVAVPVDVHQTATTVPSAVASSGDPLGERPVLGPARPFSAPVPTEFTTANGIHVWLVERPGLPLVYASLVVRTGVSSDPVDKPGLAQLTLDMMDEGAGKRGALELSNTITDLGANLSLWSNLDGSFASVSSLKGHFDEAFGVLADVVARPHLEEPDFKRVTALWKNTLRKRRDDPGSVGSLVMSSALYGLTSPYGHPSLGLLSTADSIKLDDVKQFYRSAFAPDRATVVVVGQVTRAEVETLLEKNLGQWKAESPPLPDAQPTPPLAANKRPHLILVDRPKAVQSVIVVARDGLTASDADRAGAEMLNTALGGSFTSRLNETLREKNGWTYGVSSAFSLTRAQGPFTIRTAVDAPYTAPALAEIVRELGSMSKDGLTDGELIKCKAQDRADLIGTFETVNAIGARLAGLAALGLPPNQDTSMSEKRQQETLPHLGKLASAHLDPSQTTIVVVGDAATMVPALEKAGFSNAERWTTEGVRSSPAEAAKK